MKKRLKLISFISSLLGCFVLCGILGLSSLGSKKQEVIESKADSSILVSQGVVDFTVQSDLINNLSFHVYGNYTYNRTYLGNNDGYSFVFSLQYDLIEDNNGVDTIYPIYMDSAKTQTTQTFSTGLLNGLVNGQVVKEVTSLNVRLYLRYYDVLNNGSYNVYPVMWFFYGKLGGVDNDEPLYFQNRGDFGNPYYTDYYYDIIDPDVYVNHFLITPPTELGVININADVDPYGEGYNDGYNAGYDSGYNSGFTVGTNQGYEQGVQAGKEEQLTDDSLLFSTYYNQGYSEGFTAGSSQDETVNSIFSGISSVAIIPVRFFLSIFNFEILGVNIASVVSALLSVCLVVIVIRVVKGSGKND